MRSHATVFRRRWALLISLVAALCAGCNTSAPDGPGTSYSSGDCDGSKIDLTTGPFTDNILAVVKNGSPFILIDFLPEYSRLRQYRGADGEYYLRRRVLSVVREKGLENPRFQGHDAFRVRCIILAASDEYGRPNWASAPQIGEFEVSRAAFDAARVDRIAAMSLDQVRAVFSASRLTLEWVDKVKVDPSASSSVAKKAADTVR